MTGQSSHSQHGETNLTPWDPYAQLRAYEAREIGLSRGFMRCRPEKWFPGFAAHWLPLAHSLGVEMKILEVKPCMFAPKSLEHGFLASVDDEVMAVFLDDESERTFISAVAPGSNRSASAIVLEYLARRLLTSMGLAWTGPKSTTVSYIRKARPSEFTESGAVKLSAEINGSSCSVWILLGKEMVDRLDGLWRRQVNSTAKITEESLKMHLEIAQVVVAQNMVSDYLRPGELVELGGLVNDTVTLKLSDKPWLPAKLCRIDGTIGLEMIASPLGQSSAADGLVRISVELGNFDVESAVLSEITQPGAIINTPLPLNNRVDICVNSKKSAEALLYVNEGSFAYKII